MGTECVITALRGHTTSFTFEQGTLTGLQVLPEKEETLTLYGIYTARVKHIVPNIKAANKEMGNLVFIIKFKDDTKETYNEDYTYNAKYSRFTYFENQVNDNSDSYIPNSFE